MLTQWAGKALMSSLTARLLGRRYRRGTKAQAMLLRIDELLAREYGTPDLGNFEDPVREIVSRTNATLCKRAHGDLFARFVDLEGIAAASVSEVRSVICGSGLGNKRARQLKGRRDAPGFHSRRESPHRSML